jgi:hypothetical protein
VCPAGKSVSSLKLTGHFYLKKIFQVDLFYSPSSFYLFSLPPICGQARMESISLTQSITAWPAAAAAAAATISFFFLWFIFFFFYFYDQKKKKMSGERKKEIRKRARERERLDS